MEREYDEIVCIGHSNDRSIFVDDAGDLAYKDDPNNVYDLGDVTTAGDLMLFSGLPIRDRKAILKILLEE